MPNVRGMAVILHDRCLNCDSNACFLDRGPAPAWWQLTCDGCGVARGRAGKDLVQFLEKFVEQFGWPDQPIILRTGKVHKPGSVGGDAATVKPKRRKTLTMKMNDLFPSKYLRAADLSDGPRVVTIEKVTHEPFKDDGVNVTKTVVHFKRNGTVMPPMVVNKTNWRMLVALTGADDDDNWIGHRIELRSEKVNAPGGKIVDSIRIHEAPKPVKKAKVAPEFDDEVGF